jgi:hypothetical protein
MGLPCVITPGPSDAGRVAISVVWQAAAAVLAAVNVSSSMEMAQKQFDLAQRYYRIARAWRDWYNQGFVPLENKELDEIWDEGPYEPHYEAAAGRASVTAKLVFKDKLEQVLRCTSSYATGLRQALIKDMVSLTGSATAFAEGLGIRNERARTEIMDGLRWKHREAAVSRGRGMAASNVTYAQLAAGIYGDLANQAGKAAAGYVRFIGYAEERLKTMLPEHKTYMGNSQWTRKFAQSQMGEYKLEAKDFWNSEGSEGLGG